MSDKQELKCPSCGNELMPLQSKSGTRWVHGCSSIYCPFTGPPFDTIEKSERFHQIQHLEHEIAEAAIRFEEVHDCIMTGSGSMQDLHEEDRMSRETLLSLVRQLKELKDGRV